MGSDLSCVAKKTAGATTADNVYDEADDFDGPNESIGPVHHSEEVSSPRSKSHHPQPDPHSNSSNNNNHNHHKATDKQTGRGLPLFPPNSKPTRNAKNKNDAATTSIFHDDNGYAVPFPKSGNAAATSGNSPSSPKAKGKAAEKIEEKSNASRGVGVRAVVLPTTSKPGEKARHNDTGRQRETDSSKQPDTGAYCNVILPETRSFSNDLYEDTDMQVPRLPANTRPVAKVHDSQEKAQTTELNYIQVEFVKPQEVTSKQTRARRSPSPTQYTDIVRENGKFRLMN